MTTNKPSPLNIDHVTIAGSSLAQLEAAFARVGLVTDYGGPHSNGITHMSLLGFDDGSYIELIAFLEPGEFETAFWGRHIAGDAGPCAWAALVDDVASEAKRLVHRGITVDGPHYFNRQRPDGELVEWHLAFVGDKGAGATLPFIIKDITPRRLRAYPSDSVTAPDGQYAILAGVKTVVLGVKDMSAAVTLFQLAYEWPDPLIQKDSRFGAQLAYFEDTPVVLAKPLRPDNWLAKRLSHFDDAPCAYMLGTSGFDAAYRRFELVAGENWFGHRTAWFEPKKIGGLRLGVMS